MMIVWESQCSLMALEETIHLVNYMLTDRLISTIHIHLYDCEYLTVPNILQQWGIIFS